MPGASSKPAEADDVFGAPAHPYTEALFASVPSLDADAAHDLTVIEGQPPDPAALPPGCPFEPRCAVGRGREECRTHRPALAPVDGRTEAVTPHSAACHHTEALRAGRAA